MRSTFQAQNNFSISLTDLTQLATHHGGVSVPLSALAYGLYFLQRGLHRIQ